MISGPPEALPSRQWSTETLKQGVTAVQTESKMECWSDGEEDTEALNNKIQDWLLLNHFLNHCFGSICNCLSLNTVQFAKCFDFWERYSQMQELQARLIAGTPMCKPAEPQLHKTFKTNQFW